MELCLYLGLGPRSGLGSGVYLGVRARVWARWWSSAFGDLGVRAHGTVSVLRVKARVRVR